VHESDLKAFLTLAETENTRDAAALLRVNQSNVSRSLARLEHDLGAELFTRHGRRLVLNRVGVAFSSEALAIVTGYEAGRRRVRQLSGSQATIRLGFLQSVARRVVPHLIGSFRQVRPEVRFELRQGFARDLFDLVAADELDAAFATPPRTALGLGWQLMEEQQLFVALPSGHRLVGRKSVAVEDLDSEDFIAFARPTELRQMIDPLLAAAGAQVRIAFESSEIDTIAGLVTAGLGVSILPVSGKRANPEPILVPLRPATNRLLGLGWSQERANPQSVTDFVEHCRGLDLASLSA
jgi:LysR family transcriptional regulator, transcription activator of glutamate synthase operon